jgi:hypothetical protein
MHFLIGLVIVLLIVYFAIIDPRFRLAVLIVVGIPALIIAVALTKS